MSTGQLMVMIAKSYIGCIAEKCHAIKPNDDQLAGKKEKEKGQSISDMMTIYHHVYLNYVHIYT